MVLVVHLTVGVIMYWNKEKGQNNDDTCKIQNRYQWLETFDFAP